MSAESIARGERIKERREKLGLSQAELAEAARLSQGYLSQIENGEAESLGSKILFALANALEIDAEVIVGNKEAPSLNGSINPLLKNKLAELGPQFQNKLYDLIKTLE